MKPRRGKIIKCNVCGKEFYIRPYQFETTRYCSRQCGWRAKIKEKVKLKCDKCGKDYFVQPSTYKWNKIRKRKNLFCSVKCKLSFQTGETGWNWKPNLRIKKGPYFLIRAPKDYPNKVGRIYAYEHRLIVEIHIGRFLTRKEEVHHINHDTTDNRIENLRLLSASEHAKYHSIKRQRDKNNKFL